MAFTDSTFSPETSPGYLVRLVHQMNVAAIDRTLAEDGLTATQWTTLVSLHFQQPTPASGSPASSATTRAR